jgi:hypothetical protein
MPDPKVPSLEEIDREIDAKLPDDAHIPFAEGSYRV